jgi:hypothetical protein
MAAGDLRLSGSVTFGSLTAAEVWEEPVADHAPGSAGETLANVGGVADPLLKAVPGAYPAGSGGYALGRLVGGPLSVVAPLSRAGVLTLVRGDSYTGGRALVFPNVGGDDWPADLTGWALLFSVRPYAAIAPVLTVAAVATDAVAPGQAIRIELTALETAALDPGGRYLWDVQATRFAEVVTLRRGTLEVAADAT